MTDNEITKALECLLGMCRNEQLLDCRGCAFEGESLCCENASEGITKATLDLINCQKAEIERLQTTLLKQEDTMQILGEEKQKYFDELQTANAEIERLTVNMNAFGLGMKREKERADNLAKKMIEETIES